MDDKYYKFDRSVRRRAGTALGNYRSGNWNELYLCESHGNEVSAGRMTMPANRVLLTPSAESLGKVFRHQKFSSGISLLLLYQKRLNGTCSKGFRIIRHRLTRRSFKGTLWMNDKFTIKLNEISFLWSKSLDFNLHHWRNLEGVLANCSRSPELGVAKQLRESKWNIEMRECDKHLSASSIQIQCGVHFA